VYRPSNGYVQASLEAYAHAFNGITLWKGEKVGAGLRSGEEASKKLDIARKASEKYDRAAPSTLYKAHRAFDQQLSKVIGDAVSRMEKEASTVYFQGKAKDLAALPAGQRLVSPVITDRPAAAAGGGKDGVVASGAVAFSGLPASPVRKVGCS
jgi:hypothetical protein